MGTSEEAAFAPVMQAASKRKAFGAMISAPTQPHGKPTPDEVRAQVQRMTASDVFASSPQLAAFLLFVVEAVLRGRGERLKGYTIGVEVLRRDVNFDPQIDPIVRVEATRLRRAIERYYAGPGADDPIVIDLPRGAYVPRMSWRPGKAGAVASPPAEQIVLAPGNGMPTLRVAPFVVLGTPDTCAIAPESLGSKISDAFALFEIVNVMAAPSNGRNGAAPGCSNYRLDGTLEYRGNRSVDLRFKLIDESDSTVIWSRAFEKLSGAEDGETERAIIRELASVIVQPFGMITANDRAKRLGDLDPRYQALLSAGDALRSFDPVAQIRVRDRLEQLIAIDPNFANGFLLLAVFYSREYLVGFGARPGESPPLDRALKAARRGIELRPQSARAYHLLFSMLFLRGEKEAGIVAAQKASALNPYDVLIPTELGARLIYCGDIDRGMAILRDAIGFGAVLPSWSHFALFVGHYMRGEIAEARYHASQLTSETYVYGQLARALIAHADGEATETRRAVQTILSLQPAWGEDPRREIGRLVNASAIADRLAGDLVATGYLSDADSGAS
jgi:tetratricopeptide (TPR) repeat protein